MFNSCENLKNFDESFIDKSKAHNRDGGYFTR